jgi:hypothetical protein
MANEDQRNAANDFARRKLGPEVDAAAAATTGFKVKPDGEGKGEKGDSRPWIELPGDGRQVSEFAREVGAILADEEIFIREGYPVTIDTKKGRIEVLDAEDFRSYIEQFMVPYKWKPVKGGMEKEWKTMTADCARATIKSRMFRAGLRELERVNLVQMPTFRADGRLELLPEGYDEASKTFTMKSGILINAKLTAAEGQTMLRDYLKEFPFTDSRSLGVAIAAMVGLYTAGLQEATASRLSFVFRSNVEGAGKSLAAQFAITGPFGLAKGQPLAGRDELRKLLDATALQGSPYLFLDNLTGHVASELLDAYLTTPIWTGRLLGTSKIFEAPANAMLLITGNNITVSPDIGRRSLLCNLHVEEADPQERKIQRIITPQFLARPTVRGDLLSALWAMIRGWHEAGRPQASRRIAGFAEWCDIVGGIVESNGFGNALEKPKDEEAAETKNIDKRALISRLAGSLVGTLKLAEFTFQDLVDVCIEENCFSWLVDGRMRTKKEKRDDGSTTETEAFECTKSSAAGLGRLFGGEMGGQTYKLPDGRKVRFGKHGNNRHRRYQLAVVEAEVATPVKQ